MLWKAAKITISFNNFAMVIFLKILAMARNTQKLKLLKHSDKYVMDFWLLWRKVSFIGKHLIKFRDLKPANVMKKGQLLKLGDFGFAKQIDNKSMVTTSVGTPLYMSL